MDRKTEGGRGILGAIPRLPKSGQIRCHDHPASALRVFITSDGTLMASCLVCCQPVMVLVAYEEQA